jgi:hypothetical protein
MKTLRTKTIILLFITIIAGAGLLTSCDAILEAFYPELTESGDLVVNVEFGDSMNNFTEFTNGNIPIKIALVPFFEGYEGFTMQYPEQIESLYYNDFFEGSKGSKVVKVSFTPFNTYIYKVVVWLDRNGNDYFLNNNGEPEWDSSIVTNPEPAFLATTIYGDWWVDYTSGLYPEEMNAILNLGDEINKSQLEDDPRNVGTGGEGEPPVAAFHLSNTIVQAGFAVTFYSDSWDPDGWIISREWRIVGQEGQGIDETFNYAPLSFTFPSSGRYLVDLKVKDNQGNEDTHTINVDVVESYSNQPPSASFNYYIDYIGEGFITYRFVSNSTDDDGIMDYIWNFGDGSGITYGSDVMYWSYIVGASDVDYTVSLEVVDYQYESDSTTRIFTVYGEGATNRTINVTGSIYNIPVNEYYGPIRIILYSYTNDYFSERGYREIWGNSYIDVTFDYLEADDYFVIAWYDGNDNGNIDPGEPGIAGSGGSGSDFIGEYGITASIFDLYTYNTEDADITFYDSDIIIAGADATNPSNAFPVAINMAYPFNGYVYDDAENYFYIDNLGAFSTDQLYIELEILHDGYGYPDLDLWVYGYYGGTTPDYSSVMASTYNIGSSTSGSGTQFEYVTVPANHGYNAIFIVVEGYYAEGAYRLAVNNY